MPALTFEVTGVEALAHSALPTLIFQLRVTNRPMDEWLSSVLVRCQIQINAPRRGYSADAKKRLVELFGEAERWGVTLRPLLWTHANVVVPRFRDAVTVDLAIPCTYDFDVIATKYMDALEDGEIPLTFLFSGTVFYEDTASGSLQVAQIPWEREAAYRLPVAVWRELIATYFPNTAWLRLPKDVFDRLRQYKVDGGYVSVDAALTSLLDLSATRVRP